MNRKKNLKERIRAAVCVENDFKNIWVLLSTAFILILSISVISGCGFIKSDKKKVENIDFTVVENQDVPAELKKLINEKKENTLRLTYTTKDYTYIVAGYGTQSTSGYSIQVNEVYLGTNAIYADFNLMGPQAGESVNEMPTTPYIVLKIEKREEPVVFNM